MKMNLNKQEKGFTIIEVLIVLAIAGLIVLIVFMAVPALQRNSRNTQRKNDVSAVLGGITEYSNNNGGKLPAALADFSSNYKVSFYTEAADIVYTKSATAVTTLPTGQNVVTINTFSKCNGNAMAATGATARNVTAVYYIESSGAPVAQCQDM